MIYILLALSLLTVDKAASARLQVSGKQLTYNGKQVFLSGTNFGWNHYGNDFGNGQYDNTFPTWIKEISNAGGNSFRVWVHIEGDNTPIYDEHGYVTKCDKTGDFENDILSMLNTAQEHNVLVDLCMWNGAVLRNQNTINLILDDSKLESYISNCFIPLLKKIKGHPALAAIETINEPEGSVKIESNSEKCFDTSELSSSGAGWTKNNIPMERFLKFIGTHNQAVKNVDPGMLTTLGAWSQRSQTSVFSGCSNYYTDECLKKAAGENSHLDFYQVHTYDWQGKWGDHAPFTVKYDDYKLDKPLVIGEYAASCAAGNSLNDLYDYAYNNGYSGGWSWKYHSDGSCSDSVAVQQAALTHMKGKTDHGVINFDVGEM